VLIAHMLQHILLGDIASLLLVLGLSGPVLVPLLRIRVTRPLRRLASPPVALVLWALDLYLWHVPLLYQWAIRHDLVHALEHACLLWFGGLLWLALLGPLPKPTWFSAWARLGYVVAVRFLGAVLANVLIWAQTVFYPVYRASDAARGLNPLSDQNLAGAIMMVEQMLLTVLLLAWLFLRAARQDEERQALLDFAADNDIPLSRQRDALPAAAATTAELRNRLRSSAHVASPGRRCCMKLSASTVRFPCSQKMTVCVATAASAMPTRMFSAAHRASAVRSLLVADEGSARCIDKAQSNSGRRSRVESGSARLLSVFAASLLRLRRGGGSRMPTSCGP